jgi:hypothetical protein
MLFGRIGKAPSLAGGTRGIIPEKRSWFASYMSSRIADKRELLMDKTYGPYREVGAHKA